MVGAPHWHDCFEIEFVIEGTCIEVLNGVGREMKRGDIALITPTDLHEVRSIEQLTIYNLIFAAKIIDTEILNTILLKNESSFAWSLSETDMEYALCILERANFEFHQKPNNYERFMTCAVNQLLIIILRMAGRAVSDRVPSGLVHSEVAAVCRFFELRLGHAV